MADEETGEVRNEKLDPEAEARRRLALAQIRQYPDPALRMRAREVEEFDADLGGLVERLKHLLKDANGLGLAATQIGVLRRVFAFLPEIEQEPVIVVNPSFAATSDERESDTEGCLSLQGVRVPIERPTKIVLTGRDTDGAEVRYELEGYGARIAQHELDHLNGMLIIDRTDDEHRKEALGTLRPRISLR